MFCKFGIKPFLAASLLLAALSVPAEKLKKLDLSAIQASPSCSDDAEAYDNLRRLVTVMKLLQRLYVDKDKVTMQKLVDGALKGMLHELDPYSSYEPIQDSPAADDHKAGIGIMGVKDKRSGLKVICTLKGSPAAKAGIKIGDLIVRINDVPTGNLTYQQCAKLLRGELGSKVKLELIREGSDDPLIFEVKRMVLAQSNQFSRDFKMLENGIAYIRIRVFNSNTVTFLDKALKVFAQKKGKGLIIDLRNNPGGLVSAAVAFCSRFLKENDLVITIVGRDQHKNQKILAEKCKNYTEIPLLIMINRFSASASEIVAGSLKDHKRAILLGSKSFGKGSVQRVCEIKDDGTLRFTVGKYYTPAHNIIHGKGIEPDIKVPLSLKACLRMAQQLENSPGVIQPPPKGMIVDKQLLRAVEELSAIIKSDKEQAP